MPKGQSRKASPSNSILMLQADDLDFDNFQQKVANDRNAGLVFQTLYEDKELEARQRQRRGGSTSSLLSSVCTPAITKHLLFDDK